MERQGRVRRDPEVERLRRGEGRAGASTPPKERLEILYIKSTGKELASLPAGVLKGTTMRYSELP